MSDEGTAGSCLVPRAGTEEGCGAAQGCWGTDVGGREQDPSVLLFMLDFFFLGRARQVPGLCRGLDPWLLARSLMDADTSLECWAQAASPSSAVLAKLWPLSCLMGSSQVERRVVHPIANPLRHLYCV